MNNEDPRVDSYLRALPPWQQELCQPVRALIHACDPELRETIKRTDRPYFELDGTVCALLAARDDVNLFLHDGGIVPDPQGLITSATLIPRPGRSPSGRAIRSMFRG